MDRGRSNATRLGEQTDYFVVVSVIVDPSEPCWIDRARIRERNHRDEPCDQNQCDDHQEWLPTSGVSGSSHYAPLPLFMDGRPLRSWDQRGRNFRRSDELCQASLTHHLVFMTNRSAALLRVGKSFLMTRGIPFSAGSAGDTRAGSASWGHPRLGCAASLADDRRSEELAAWVEHVYSITWSARSSTDCGIVSPRAFAVLRLMTSSNLVGCSTGRSAGFAPFKILSTKNVERRNSSLRSTP